MRYHVAMLCESLAVYDSPIQRDADLAARIAQIVAECRAAGESPSRDEGTDYPYGVDVHGDTAFMDLWKVDDEGEVDHHGTIAWAYWIAGEDGPGAWYDDKRGMNRCTWWDGPAEVAA